MLVRLCYTRYFNKDPTEVFRLIVIEEQKSLLKLHVYDELTISDFREFEDAVNKKLGRNGKLSLLLDFNNMTSFTLDTALEEIQFNRQHIDDYQKIAVITSDQWVTWVTWLATVFTHADVQKFPDTEMALDWLAS